MLVDTSSFQKTSSPKATRVKTGGQSPISKGFVQFAGTTVPGLEEPFVLRGDPSCKTSALVLVLNISMSGAPSAARLAVKTAAGASYTVFSQDASPRGLTSHCRSPSAQQ